MSPAISRRWQPSRRTAGRYKTRWNTHVRLSYAQSSGEQKLHVSANSRRRAPIMPHRPAHYYQHARFELHQGWAGLLLASVAFTILLTACGPARQAASTTASLANNDASAQHTFTYVA